MNYEEVLKCFEEAIGLSKNFDRKGKTMPYTSANGHMFSQINKDGELGIRLPKEQQEFLKTEHSSVQFMSYGAKMRDYVTIPEDILTDSKELSGWLEKGYDYVMSMPAK